MPDWFLDIFSAEAERLVEQLRARLKRSPGLPLSWWASGLPEPAGDDIVVSAVDGGGGVQPLAGGGGVYIARAFGYRGDMEPVRDLELRIYPVRDTVILDALRTWVEHRVALRCVNSMPPGSVLLMDGSYWAVVVSNTKRILRAALGPSPSVSLAYASLLGVYVLSDVVELASKARERGVLVAYVSKDYNYRGLKEHVMALYISSRAPGLAPLLSKSIEWYPLADRELLVAARRGVAEELKPVFDAMLDSHYRDYSFIVDSVGKGVGFSKPLRLPPPRRIGRTLSTTPGKEIVEGLCSRIGSVLGDREAAECFAAEARLRLALEKMPSTLQVYVKLGVEDSPILVEMLFPEKWFYQPGRVMYDGEGMVERLLSVLVRDYGGTEYYNIPLVTAHNNASLSARQLASYMSLLEALAATRGVVLPLARRSMLPAAGRRQRSLR